MPLPIAGKAHQAAPSAPFTWFIYGSSLDRAAFEHWAGEHGYRVPDFSKAIPARLDGWRLAFDVVSRFWGGAVASLVAAPGESVEGLALLMPSDSRGLVDHKEGAISGLYAPLEVRVVPLAGGPPVDAVAYASVTARRVAEQAPSKSFVQTLVKGAREHGLSAGWIARLEKI